MCGSSPKAPKPQAMLPEAPVAPDQSARMGSGDGGRKRRAKAGGTILTSSQGVQSGQQTSQKTLLGS